MFRSSCYEGVNVVEEDGVEIFRLLSGDPNLYEGGWDTPEHMKNAVIRAINDGYNMYPHRLPGSLDRLTRAIVSWEKKMNNITYLERDIIPTQGISGGIRLVYSSILKPGDEIVLTDPTYIPYIRGVKEHSGKAVFFKKIEEEDWTPDLDELRKRITNRTKGLVLIHPNNPTGALYDEKTLKGIVDIAGEFDFPLISDEIYGFFVFDGAKFKSLPLVAGDVPCLVMNSLSKSYVATGWRIGHIAIHDPAEKIDDIRRAIEANRSIAGTIPTPLIFGAVAAYEGPTDHIDGMVEELTKRRDLSYRRLNEIDGISSTNPKAAFFIFPRIEGVGKIWKDDEEFARDLKVEKHIAVGPGSYYGDIYAKGHVRIPYLPGLKVLSNIFDTLESFMRVRSMF